MVFNNPITIHPPFGSTLPTRSWSDASRAYRYGFNGKEKDSETANDYYDFGARIYDGRLGRWLSLDPLMNEFVGYSAYNFGLNSLVYFLDPDGKKIINPYNKADEKQLDNWIKVQTAIEMVKLIQPDLYNKLETSTYIFNVNITNISEYEEPKISDGNPSSTTYGSAESSSHTIGQCIYDLDPINKGNGDVVAEYSEEEGMYKYFKKSIKKDANGINMQIPDPSDPTKLTYVFEETEITEMEANGLLKLGANFDINIDNGISSAYLLGKVFTHELEHANFVIENKALDYVQNDLVNDDTDSEYSAVTAEKQYSKKHTNKLEKQAKDNVKTEQNKTE